MASCITPQWANAAPQAKLEVTQTASTATTSTLTWKLSYIATSAASASADRDYTVTINGKVVKTGSYNINNKKGTYQIATGTVTINKTTSAQSIPFKVEFEFKLTWGGTYGGFKSASSKISVAAKTKYTVTYNANGGSGAPGDQIKWHGTKLTLSTSEPTRSGYDFSKWNTNSSGTGTSYNSGGTYFANSNVTLYAVWELKSYTITYNANGGSGAPENQNKTHGVNLTISTTEPSKNGYNFKGWSLTRGGNVYYTAGSTCGKNEDLTLYAVWELKSYTITYNANGGSGAPSAQNKTHGANIAISTTKPTKNGYDFLLWATTPSGDYNSYNPGDTYSDNANITLYARWRQVLTAPEITNIDVYRCTETGVESDKGTYIRAKFNWTCYNGTSGKIGLELSWRKTSDESYGTNHFRLYDQSTDPVTIKDTTVNGRSGVSDTIFGDGLIDPDFSYTIQLYLTDGWGLNATERYTLDGGRYIIDVLGEGKGIAFGKPAELDGFIDFGRDAIFTNPYSIYGRMVDGVTMETFQAMNENNNTVVGYGHYANAKGNTHIYGHDINFGVSNVNGNKVFYKPYYSKGDSWNLIITTAGYVTNSGTEVTFQIPLAKPVIGSPSIAVSSNNGFRLRQNNAYTHGSSASVYVAPDSYSVISLSYGNGIAIKATFSNTANVINNAAIGVYWSGKIELS